MQKHSQEFKDSDDTIISSKRAWNEEFIIFFLNPLKEQPSQMDECNSFSD
jgi:hypothetical protein